MTNPASPNREALHGAHPREIVVRFSHIDAAGIVFYPRYIEMIAQSYPELALDRAPFTLTVDFTKPTPLGTRLKLALRTSAPDGGWQLSGGSGDEQQFSMAWHPGPDDAPQPGDHDSDRPAFRSDVMRIDDWAAGPGGRLQLSRYYEFVNAAVEQWFETELDLPFRQLHGDGAGIPTVSLLTRCAELPRLGDEVRIWIRPTRIGSRSVRLDSCLVNARGCLIRTSQVIVFVRLEQRGFRSAPLPSALRAALLGQLAGTTS